METLPLPHHLFCIWTLLFGIQQLQNPLNGIIFHQHDKIYLLSLSVSRYPKILFLPQQHLTQ
ncbi:hypothetical protein [Escherichia phage FL20]